MSETIHGLLQFHFSLLISKKERGRIQLSVADPTQLLSDITITLNGNYSGENIEMKNGKANVKILFPTAWEAGKTITVYLNENTLDSLEDRNLILVQPPPLLR